MPLNWITNGNDVDTYKQFFKSLAQGGWNLLLNYLCNSYMANSQRGNGLRKVYNSRGTVVPLNIIKHIQKGQGQPCPAQTRIRSLNVAPTEQTIKIAKSEEKREKKMQENYRPPIKKSKKHNKAHSSKSTRGGKTSRRTGSKKSSKSPLFNK